MRTELLKKKTRSACANVTGGAVDSLRLKTETSTTVRVYDNGFIGIAGKIGFEKRGGKEYREENSLPRFTR